MEIAIAWIVSGASLVALTIFGLICKYSFKNHNDVAWLAEQNEHQIKLKTLEVEKLKLEMERERRLLQS